MSKAVANRIKKNVLKPFDPTTSLVLGNVFDLFGTLDGEGRVVDIFGNIFQRTKTDPSRLQGQVFAETVFWQSSEENSETVTSAVYTSLNGETVKLEVEFRVSSKERVPVELTLIPIESDGNATLFVGARRITGVTSIGGQLEDASKQLLFAAENADIGLWFWDFQRKYIHSTPQCNELLGLKRNQRLTYDAFLAVVHPDDRNSVAGFIENSRRSGEKYENEFRVIYANGDTEWICAEGKSILSDKGRPETMMGILRKTTDQKVAAEELAAVYEREKSARDEAVEANRAKDIFLAFVSHELRAPLNAILGWANILLTKNVDEETRRNAMETIENSARMQTKLINDLVDSARVASGKIRLEYRPTDLVGVVKGAFEAQRPSAEGRGLVYELNAECDDCFVFGDAGRLQQVFGNLLSNAIKFTPAGGSVLLEMTADKTIARVSISDSGEGISVTALPDIFRQFSQGEGSENRSSVGLGLGLSIAKTLVERHGGTVTAESEGVGRGSQFIVTLPIADSTAKQDSTDRSENDQATDSLKGLYILIIEDEDDSREVLRLFLENIGAKVVPAANAEAAMKILTTADSPPDLIVSDIGMPVEDGLSLMRRIRSLKDRRLAEIPAIELSAFATNETKESSFSSGFQKYVTKPFEPELLTSEILALVGKKV